MTRDDFKKLRRGDVLQWNGDEGRGLIGLVIRIDPDVVAILWENTNYCEYHHNDDAKDLEHCG